VTRLSSSWQSLQVVAVLAFPLLGLTVASLTPSPYSRLHPPPAPPLSAGCVGRLLATNPQHEGENFYLDVAEVRTFANSPIILSGDANAPPENGSDAGGEGKRVRLVCLLGDLDLEVEFCPAHAPMPQVDPSGGQPPDRCEEHHHGNLLREHPPGVETARALNRQGSHTSMDEGTAPPGRFPPRSASTSSPYAVSGSPMTTTAGSSAFNIATGRDGDQAGGLGGALPLPAPARVMKACGAHGYVSALKSVRWESGE